MTETVIREATASDVPGIRRVAERGWNAAYRDILTREAIDAALAEWYDPDSVRAFVEQEDAAYFVAEREVGADAGGATDAGHDGSATPTIVGYAGGGPGTEDGVARLGAIYVDPDFWGRGIGTALLDAFEEFCRERGCEVVEFEVLAGNEVGASFYRKHGYEPVEEREAEVFGDTVRERIFRGRITG